MGIHHASLSSTSPWRIATSMPGDHGAPRDRGAARSRASPRAGRGVRLRRNASGVQVSKKEMKGIKLKVAGLSEEGLELSAKECRLACMAEAKGAVQIELLGDTDL